jgi:hypothetical protein
MPPLEPEPMSDAASARPLEAGELPPIGAPFCRVCDYDLSGCVDSAKCPECGGALVDVLMRPELQLQGGRRRQSRARIMGMPAIDIAFGPSGNERRGRARGFIALGDEAQGVFAFGGQARGVVAVGGLAMGGVTVGGTSLGVLSTGGMAMGLLSNGGMAVGGMSSGGMAVGGIAQGGMAIGYAVRGGGRIGPVALGGGGPDDPLGGWMAPAISWFLGGAAPSAFTFIMPMFLFIAVAAISGIIAWAIAQNRIAGDPGWEVR